ncbi:uncharacterized protein LOC129808743 [Phlebotomus papatasi]|uniref:uncharacterized protein LOC129808743 n=1 Tax=Phlebotomus papatasi TaxID=29031 RepID=UPI00248411EF|nr:uncharacterized protein LOC129808743 [Phlebotomus papatasi]
MEYKRPQSASVAGSVLKMSSMYHGVFLVLFLGVATARPEAGYSYSAPQRPSFAPQPTASGAGFSGSAQSFAPGPSFSGGGTTLVQKHIYVHVPPPEPEEPFHQHAVGGGGVAQKHYKIIFIKAPSPPQPTPAQIAQAAQNSEKTIVYVLVKRPEAPEDIVLPSAAPVTPSKPEVYFIRYKTQREQAPALPQPTHPAPSLPQPSLLPQTSAPSPIGRPAQQYGPPGGAPSGPY